MSKNKSVISWNHSRYGVELRSGNRHVLISAMPNMVGRLDTAVKCCETMGNWRLPTFRETELIVANISQVNALMEQNGGHRIDLESVLWLDGDYGPSSALKTDEGLCYILQYRQDALCWWWNRREFRLVMSLGSLTEK